jgi:hypothetical protein
VIKVAAPTVTLDVQPDVPDSGTPGRLIPLKVKAIVGLLGLALFGFICYGIGTNHGTGSHVLTGRAYVSPSQGSVKVNGWAYGFAVSPNGMNWYDSRGGSHEGGIPPCMQQAPRYAWIRFGYVEADGLHEDSWRVVTWVQCIAQP